MGKAADNGLKKEAWEQIKQNMNEKFNINYSIDQLKTAEKGLKKKYGIVKKLQDQSGFGWNPVTQTVVAEPDVWNAYVAVHKDAKEFRTQSFPFYDKLHMICDGRLATGDHVFVASNPSRISLYKNWI